MTSTATDDIAFPGPDEIEGFWALDKMHAPRPITPLSYDLVVKTLTEGFTKAQAEYDCPIMVSYREINHYFYVAFHPIPDETEIQDRLTRYHDNLAATHRKLAAQWDQPIAAFLGDLKVRGLFDSTLVQWGGEFGRTPVAEYPALNGRDHNHYGFTCWLAGGGVKGGQAYGATDEFGFAAAENRVHVHDLHATMLHLLGFDHTRLTYRYAGRDFRLTDVHGTVIPAVVG